MNYSAAGAILSKNEEIDRLKNIEQMNARRINELESELQDLKNESVKCSDAVIFSIH
jgi:hypothetical protein